jgi:hypothetical protein
VAHSTVHASGRPDQECTWGWDAVRKAGRNGCTAELLTRGIRRPNPQLACHGLRGSASMHTTATCTSEFRLFAASRLVPCGIAMRRRVTGLAPCVRDACAPPAVSENDASAALFSPAWAHAARAHTRLHPMPACPSACAAAVAARASLGCRRPARFLTSPCRGFAAL